MMTRTDPDRNTLPVGGPPAPQEGARPDRVR